MSFRSGSLPVFFFLLCLLAASCSSRKAEVILSQAADHIDTQPEASKLWLEAADSSLFNTRRLRADRSLILADALDRLGIDTSDLSAVSPAVKFYGRRKPFQKQARSWYYHGKVLTCREEYPEALVSLIRAKKAAGRINDVTLMSQISEATGDVYSKCFLYEDALKQYQESYILCKEGEDPAKVNSIRYAMARTYNNLRRYGQADSLFRSILKDGPDKMDSTLYTRFLADYALFQVNHTHDYLLAEVLYGLALSRRPSFSSFNHWGAFAYSKSRNGKAAQADILFNQLKEMGKDANYAVQVWAARSKALRSEYKEAYELLDRSVDSQSEKVSSVLRQSALRAQSDYFEGQFERSKQENHLVRWIIVLVFVLMMIIIYVLYDVLQRKMHAVREHEETLIETASSLSDKLEALQQERSYLQTQYVRIHQAHLKEFGSLLKTTLGTNETNLDAKQATLYQKAKKTMETIVCDQNGERVFEEELNRCFDGAMIHLRAEHPNHTEDYYRFAGFVFAGFDNETLMAITGTRSLDSIYSKKKRLRQDIAGSPTEHRDQLLQLVR